MMSKTLFIVLIGCAVAFATPVKQDVLEQRSIAEEVAKIGSGFKGLIKEIFKAVIGQIGGAIKANLQHAFQKIGERLHTEEYNEAIEEFINTMEKIDEAEKRLKDDKETQEYIEKEADKVGEAFMDLISQAINKINNNEEGTVNAEEFKKIVHEFAQHVDKVLYIQ